MGLPLDRLKGPWLRCTVKEGPDYCLLLVPQKTSLPGARSFAAFSAVIRLKCYHAESRKIVSRKEAYKIVSIGSCPHVLIQLPNYKVTSSVFSSVLCHLITQLAHSWVLF